MNIRLIVTKLTNSSENATGNNKFKLLQVSFLQMKNKVCNYLIQQFLIAKTNSCDNF